MRVSDMRAPPAILSYLVPLLQPLSKQRPNRRSSSPASRGPCAQPPHPEDEAPHRPSVRLPRVHASPILICWRASSPPCTATIPQRSKRRLASAPPPLLGGRRACIATVCSHRPLRMEHRIGPVRGHAQEPCSLVCSSMLGSPRAHQLHGQSLSPSHVIGIFPRWDDFAARDSKPNTSKSRLILSGGGALGRARCGTR
jgi:hypothetical protein